MIYPDVVMGICENGFSDQQSRQAKGSALAVQKDDTGNQTIDSLNISNPAKQVLIRKGVRVIEELPEQFSREDLLRLPHFGPVSLSKVERVLKGQGLKLLDRFPEEVDSNSIESLNISTRAKRALFRVRVHTVDILVMYTPKQLLRVQDFGVLSLNEVVNALSQRGRTLHSDDY